MNHEWNRYAIISEAFEASVQRLGFLDASLFGIMSVSLAAMGFFGATGNVITAALLLLPVLAAWRGIIETGSGRSRREINALVGGVTEGDIERAIRNLASGYRHNEKVYAFKLRTLRLSGVVFLAIITLGILVPLGAGVVGGLAAGKRK